MTVLEFTLLLFLAAILAGFLGALTGLGGGLVIIPLLTLAFGADIRYAIGASLVSVIATSSGAGSAYVREGFTNLRIGMFLEVATTLGALAGASLATHIAPATIAILFGGMLLYSAYLTILPKRDTGAQLTPDRLAERLRFNSSFPTPQGPRAYTVRKVPAGFGGMFIAGALSGLLGIGSGAVKVLAMDRLMRIPFKVSTATSNFMIGVTAAASAGIYLNRGFIDPSLAMPVMLGVLIGSLAGARVLAQAETRVLRLVFSCVLVVLAGEMIYKAVVGGI